MPCSATCAVKKPGVTLFPTGRPCMSGKATTTVSMEPSAIPVVMSSSPGMTHDGTAPRRRHPSRGFVRWAHAHRPRCPPSARRGGEPTRRRRAGCAAVIPLVGVSTYVADAAWGSWRRPSAVLPESYYELVASAGARPLLLPPPRTAEGGPGAAAADVIGVLDGLVLTGGGDVDPAQYG